MPDAFLESSALIELVFRHREIRTKVESVIPVGCQPLTSRYVLFEIVRGYLQSLILLHNKALAVKNMVELHEYTHSGQQLLKRHRSGTMLGAFEDFLAHLETLRVPLTEEQRLQYFRAWLAMHLRRGWRRIPQVVSLINRVGCREDIPPPTNRATNCYDQL